MKQANASAKLTAGSPANQSALAESAKVGSWGGATGTTNPGFGLYLHWPFCQSKCPYCDFNSHVAAAVDQNRWRSAYLSEIERAGVETAGRVLQSVFFGGGTPSLMDPQLVAAILEKVRTTWPMSNDPEITMEANPGSVEAGRFAAYRQAGVNRISIGVQALDDLSLQRLGRMHSVSDAIKAVEIGQATFPRASFDLIYARQDQTLADWKAELQVALNLAPTHLSLYQLTVEEGTVFHERNQRGLLKGLPEEGLAADLFLLTQEMTENAGLGAYEVSNHANPGEESRHNLTYWRGGDYIGAGPGAHGRLSFGGKRHATEAIRAPQAWLDAVERENTGELPRSILDPGEVATEYLLMGLRLREGVDIRRLEALIGAKLNWTAVSDLATEGLLEVLGDRLRTTQTGTLVLNSILRNLLVT